MHLGREELLELGLDDLQQRLLEHVLCATEVDALEVLLDARRELCVEERPQLRLDHLCRRNEQRRQSKRAAGVVCFGEFGALVGVQSLASGQGRLHHGSEAPAHKLEH